MLTAMLCVCIIIPERTKLGWKTNPQSEERE